MWSQFLSIFMLIVGLTAAKSSKDTNEDSSYTAIMLFSKPDDSQTLHKQCVSIQPGGVAIPDDPNDIDFVSMSMFTASQSCSNLNFTGALGSTQGVVLPDDGCLGEKMSWFTHQGSSTPKFLLWSSKKFSSVSASMMNNKSIGMVYLWPQTYEKVAKILGSDLNHSWQMKVYHLYQSDAIIPKSNIWPYIILVALAVVSVSVGCVLGAMKDRLKEFKIFEVVEPSGLKGVATLLIYLLFVAGLLLSLYFFYHIMVWPCYVMILLAMMFALADILSYGMIFICNIGQYKYEMSKELCGVKFINKLKWILLPFCFVVVLMFFLYRHSNFAFIFVDILGFAVCANIIRTVRFPNLKILTVVLVCVFAYDIFMVFITPFFMRSSTKEVSSSSSNAGGENTRRRRSDDPSDSGLYDPFHPMTPESKAVMSVMESVALGGVEQLPLLFKVPQFLSSFWWNEDNILCFSRGTQYAMLGFGDVILPGLLFRFLISFDFQRQFRLPLYFLCCMLGYIIGFVFTGLALMLMKKGQPALLYLVPGTLLPTVIVSLLRQEFSLLWTGPFPVESVESVETELITENEEIMTMKSF